ncbi:MAG: hypothetical protein IIB31_00845, partial [Chloroflexi bacterium]|nr:hypothetical protein [Chloroflexota bacterium]
VVALAREIAPPDYLREQVESNIAGTVEYLDGQSSSLELFIDLDPPLERAKPTIFSYIDQRIDSIEILGASSGLSLLEQITRVEELTRGIMWDLATGKTPNAIPPIGIIPSPLRDDVFDNILVSILDDSSIVQKVRQGLEDNLPVIRQEFIAGDTRQFLKEAAHAGLTPLLDLAIGEVSQNLDGQNRMDVIATMARNNPDVTEQSLRADLANLQQLLGRIKTWGKTVALLVGIGASVVLFLIYLPSLTNALRWPGLVLFFDGLILFILSKILATILPGRITPLISEYLGQSPDIPLSAVALISDLAQSFNQQIFSGMGAPALIILLVGALMFGGSFLVVFLKPVIPGIR